MATASIAAYGAGALSCFAFGTTLAAQLLGRKLHDEAESDEEDDVPPPPPATAQRRAKAGASSAKFMTLPGWEGFSMEESRQRAEREAEEALARSPAEILAGLQKGNVRFWTGHGSRVEKTAFERRALITKQWPTIAVLGCSDSRVPIEIVFDQSLGDIFVIRVAGNCLDTATTGSLQYAINHLGVKVVMIMGHEGCGAVKAATQTVEAIETQPRALSTVLKSLKLGLEQHRFQNMQDRRAADREAVVTNVRRQIESLTDDQGVMGKVSRGELLVVGAFYELSSGIVDYPFAVSESSPTFHHKSKKQGQNPTPFVRQTTPSHIRGVSFML
mmetsp:Transcript_44980/g.127231  ORF Transcript_44980/g.127231 Transcript_44980/m.127231 type:complete len:330 (+) Transcript_44980:68-1057(+)